MKTERQKVIEKARPFALLLTIHNLSEEDIDAAIEELRPLRHHIHAIDYGSAAGFCNIDSTHKFDFEGKKDLSRYD